MTLVLARESVVRWIGGIATVVAAALMFGAAAPSMIGGRAVADERPAAEVRYPERPIRFIVPFSAATPVDVLARIAAQKLGDAWHSTVIVENHDGAAGTIGVGQVVKSQPDGYTLLFTPDLPIVVGPAVSTTSYDPRTDLVPIGAVGEGVSVLVVNPSTGITSVAGLVAAARAKPGALTYASSGEGSSSRMCLELIKHATGVDIVHVPYKSAAPAIQAVLKGEVSMYCGPLFQALPGMRAHQLTAIGVTSTHTVAGVPDVPTIASQGFPDVIALNWWGMLAPAGTPVPIQEKIRNALMKAFDDPDVRSKLSAAGIDPIWKSGPEFEAMIRADLDKWTRLARAIGIRPQ
jgi:tripartite-type tricarboxylate transporter receptor subunit TctC